MNFSDRPKRRWQMMRVVPVSSLKRNTRTIVTKKHDTVLKQQESMAAS